MTKNGKSLLGDFTIIGDVPVYFEESLSSDYRLRLKPMTQANRGMDGFDGIDFAHRLHVGDKVYMLKPNSSNYTDCSKCAFDVKCTGITYFGQCQVCQLDSYFTPIDDSPLASEYCLETKNAIIAEYLRMKKNEGKAETEYIRDGVAYVQVPEAYDGGCCVGCAFEEVDIACMPCDSDSIFVKKDEAKPKEVISNDKKTITVDGKEYRIQPNGEGCLSCGDCAFIDMNEDGVVAGVNVCAMCGRGTEFVENSADHTILPFPDERGRKDDIGKLRYDLIPTSALRALAEVLTHGAEKYDANNWQGLDDFEARYQGALMRHYEAYRDGESHDPDSGLPHLAHVLCNAAFLLWKQGEE